MKKILLIDNDNKSALNKKQELIALGYHTDRASCGSEALDKILKKEHTGQYDLVLMSTDIFKDLEGIAAAEQIIEEYSIPVIFMGSETNAELSVLSKIFSSCGILAADTDISVFDTAIKTADKIADRKLKTADMKNAWLTSLVENSDNIIAFRDLKLKVLAANQAYADAAGYPSVESMLGKNDAEIFKRSPEEEPVRSYMADEKVAQKLQKGETITREEPVITAAGEKRIYLTKKYPVYDGKILIGTGNISVDITEQKARDKELLKSESRFRIIFSQINDGVYIHPILPDFTPGCFTLVNDAAHEIHGYTKEELLRMTPWDLTDKASSPKSNPEAMKQLMEKGNATFEAVHMTRDGKRITVEVNAKFIEYEGQPHVISVTRDITGYKVIQKELETALEEKKILLNELNHRIKNSFMMIESMLKLGAAGMTDKEVLGLFNDIITRIKTMSELYSLLYESEIREKVFIDVYCTRIVEMLRKAYAVKAGDVLISIDFQRVETTAKQSSVIGLIVNEILTNSLKYAFPGNRKGEIKLSLKQEDGTLSIIISDNGIGLPGGFDPANSSGIGMKLIHGMAAQLKGTVQVTANEGTRVSLSIPLGND